MGNKFHINSKGVASPCNATKRKCPLAGVERHFNTIKEAQDVIDSENKEKYGLLPKENDNTKYTGKQGKRKVTFNVVKSNRDRDYVEMRKEQLKGSGEGNIAPYIERCKSTKRLDSFRPLSKGSRHYEEDRENRRNGLTKAFGKGNLVGHYRVNHLIGSSKNSRFMEQVVEIRDNGRITIYGNNNKVAITTFMAHRTRIEAMMIQAGEIPKENFLEKVAENKHEARRLNLD